MKSCYCCDKDVPQLLMFCQCTSLMDSTLYTQSLLIIQDKVSIMSPDSIVELNCLYTKFWVLVKYVAVVSYELLMFIVLPHICTYIYTYTLLLDK